MKYYLFIFSLIVYSVNSQTIKKIEQTFSKEVDGFKISIDVPTTFEQIDDPNDKFKTNTVFLISKIKTSNVYRNVFKVSQKSIPQNFTDEMINQMMEDKNKSIQMFTSMKRTNPLIQLDMNSFTSKLINGLKFYKIEFKNGMENNISLFTIHKRKMFFIYFTYLNLVDGEMSEFENILKSIIIK